MVFIFAKTPSDDLASLAKEVDSSIAKNKNAKLSAVINFTGQPTDTYLEKIRAFADKNKIENIALTTTSTQDRFKVNPKATVTVMNYKGKSVRFNYATDGEVDEKGVQAVVKGISKILE